MSYEPDYDKILAEINKEYELMGDQIWGMTPVVEPPSKPSMNDPKPKHVENKDWKGSINMPYDPDVDNIEDYKWR